ncbi:MAG: MFS transporter [Isosphaeraceae bacterium]
MRFRLSLMMALVYAVQGAFWPLLAVHLKDLGIAGPARGWIFATLAIGSVAMPLGAGQFVDRRMASQRLLGLICAVATLFLILLAAGVISGAGRLFLFFLAFWLVVAPIFTLSNTIALRHLDQPQSQFAGVRLWGTVGWMAVGWAVSIVMAISGSAYEGRGAFDAFWVSALLAGVLSVYSFTLPHTPPLASLDEGPSGQRGLAGAIALTRKPGMPVFLLTALGVHLTTPFVFQVMPNYLESRGLPRAWISSALTIGQVPEIAMLAALPWVMHRIGTKATLAMGVGSWVIRYGSLAFQPPLWVVIAGMPLHGVAIACFTVAGQVYMDSRADRELRASAQGLYMVLTAGLGCLGGSLLAGQVVGRLSGDYARVFLVPCVIDAALLVYFCAGFRTRVMVGERRAASFAVHPMKNDAVRGVGSRVGNLVTESADG